MEEKVKNVDNQLIGGRIREEREKFGLTREEFAEIVDFSPLYIGQLERGERQMSLIALVKIADSLHISTDYLIYGKVTEQVQEHFISEESKDYPSYDKGTEGEKERNILYKLLSKCSKKEIQLITNMTKLILPYIK